MNEFIGFIKKEFYHIFRDVRTMLILFVMPIAQILIFGYVVTNDIKDIQIAILDKSKDNTTKEITNKILSSGYFILNKNLSSDKEIEEIFKKGDVKEVIIFEPNFDRKFEKEKTANIQIIADASDANTANLITNYTSAIIYDYLKKSNKNVQVPVQIVPKVRMVFNESLKTVYMFVPGTMALILMLISAMMTSISIAREKELGTMEVLLVSPLKPIQIIIGKVIPYIAISFTNAITIILLAYFVFGLPVNGSIVLLLAETILFILLALSLGILISTIAKSQQVAMFISMFALMLPTMLLSGFIYPIENMPEVLQWLCHIMPPKYFITIIKNIMIKGTGFMFVWKETLILTLMTLLFIILSIKKFKIRLE
jgi:ABC-2 type transport system permease protein